MLTPRIPASRIVVVLCLFALAPLVQAQSSPTSYTVVEAGQTPGATTTFYRSGSKAMAVFVLPAQGATPASRTFNLYELSAGVNYSWNPDDKNVPCSANNFSGDWGDPFAMISDLNKEIAKGDVKLAGTEAMDGVSTQIYSGSSEGVTEKVWLDKRDGLVLRVDAGAPGQAMTTMVDVTSFSLAPPDPKLFVLPAACAGVKPPPTAAQLIADETGDSADNYVTAFIGPGSKNSCSVVMRVLEAKTMTPLTHLQVAIDTQYDQNDPNPPHYNFGVGNDGTETMSGGHLRQITSIHNGVVDLGVVPPYFNLVVNAVHPGHSGGLGLIYRQCFAPTTVLLFLYKNYGQANESVDALWAKSGKYATPPAH